MKDLKTDQQRLAPMNAVGAIQAMLTLIDLHGDVLPDLPTDKGASLEIYQRAAVKLFKAVPMECQIDPGRVPVAFLSPAQVALLLIESVTNSVNAGLVDLEAFNDHMSRIAAMSKSDEDTAKVSRAGLLILATMHLSADSVTDRISERVAHALTQPGGPLEIVRAGSPEELLQTLAELAQGAPPGTKLN
jgi:hypothetical protein